MVFGVIRVLLWVSRLTGSNSVRQMMGVRWCFWAFWIFDWTDSSVSLNRARLSGCPRMTYPAIWLTCSALYSPVVVPCVVSGAMFWAASAICSFLAACSRGKRSGAEGARMILISWEGW